MKIFGYNIGRTQKVEMSQPEVRVEKTSPNHFSVSYGGEFARNKDLTKPCILNSTYNYNYVPFDIDNLYPQRLNLLYYQSALHQGLINYKVDTLYGDGWETNYTKNDNSLDTSKKVRYYHIVKFLKNNYRILLRDWLIHERIYIKLKLSKEGNVLDYQRIDPEKIRHKVDPNTLEVKECVYNIDWQAGGKNIPYKIFSKSNKDEEQILMFQSKGAGFDYYALPGYISAANDMYLSGQLSLMRKSYITNSIFPSFAIIFPNEGGPEEIEKRIQMIKGARDASERGRVLMLEGNGTPDSMPKIETIAGSGDDKIFLGARVDANDQICFAHQINPSLAGIKVNNALGNAGELEIAEKQFLRKFYPTNSEVITDFINSLFDACGLNGANFKMIPSPSFYITDEKSQMGSNNKNDIQSINVNDNLKNLTAKQHQQMLRIVRQYSKEIITKEQASLLLRTSFGLNQDEINIMLDDNE